MENMEWLPVPIALVLFIFFPKKIFVAACIIVAIGAGVFGYLNYDDWRMNKEKEAITVVIEYAPEECNEPSPLKIIIDNASSSTVSEVKWDISVKEPGSGSELAEYSTHDYSHDKKLKPKESVKICARIPKLRREIKDFSKLDYSIENKSVSFQ